MPGAAVGKRWWPINGQHTEHPTHRLCFCYPTTGTATEGYRDYLYAPEQEFDAELFHGRAAVGYRHCARCSSGRRQGRGRRHVAVESLDAWSTPIVACTVDTVWGLDEHRPGLYCWPALAGKAFVFDEISRFAAGWARAGLRFRAARRAGASRSPASLPKTQLLHRFPGADETAEDRAADASPDTARQ